MSKRHTTAAIVFIAVAAAVLFAMPAGAQDYSHTTYIPQVEVAGRDWFTLDELYAGMDAAGYDPAVVAGYTACYLDGSATPPHDIRYSSCTQYYVDGAPSHGTVVVYWYTHGQMHFALASAAQGW